jgi:hypothetical protein
LADCVSTQEGTRTGRFRKTAAVVKRLDKQDLLDRVELQLVSSRLSSQQTFFVVTDNETEWRHDIQHNDTQQKGHICDTQLTLHMPLNFAIYVLNVIMLNVIMLNVIMLNVIMLNVIMLNVIMLNVVIVERIE